LAKDPTIPEEDEDMKNDSRDLAVFYFFVGVESGLGILMQVSLVAVVEGRHVASGRVCEEIRR
jgi:hypothetical protein